MNSLGARFVIFDVVGTLFSLERLGEVFREYEVPGELVQLWFARLLHSAFAHTLAGRYRPFRELAGPALRQLLESRRLETAVVEPALHALRELDPWPDADECLAALRAQGREPVALTNGGLSSLDALLRRVGLHEHFSSLNSADRVGACKPHPAPYEDLLQRLRIEPRRTFMVAAHAWDIIGANAVGMRTIYVRRLEQTWPFPEQPPDLSAAALADVPGLLSVMEG